MLRRYWGPVVFAILTLSIPVISPIVQNMLISSGKKGLLFGVLLVLPYILFAVIGFLGMRLNQKRILFTSMTFILLYGYLNDSWLGSLMPLSNAHRGQSIVLIMPISLLL